MPKPKIPNQRKAALEHRKRIERYVALIAQLYDKLNKEAARIAVSTGHDTKKQFMWSDYPETIKAVKDLQQKFVSEMTAIIMSGTSAEWRESDLVQDLVAKKVLKAYTGTSKSGEEYTRYFETDPDALKAFQERKTAGMNLSQRVWNLSEQYKTELEMAVTAAIEPGTSAMELAANIKKCLNEPDMMFRRFRYKDEDGNWRRKWKQKVTDGDGKVRFIDADPKSYHPGRGIYRSSARNAQRLARTEISMAYHTAEQERWGKFDFVVGYEVKITQNGKHVPDICDDLKGKYPKNFKFRLWHPQCHCYTIPILKSEDEFWWDDDGIKSMNEVQEVPKGFADWVEKNKERIERAEKRGTVPYFIADNRKVVKDILEGRKSDADSTNQSEAIEACAKRVEEVANIIIKNGYHSSREAQMPPLNIGSVSSVITDYAEKNQIDLDSHDLYITTKGIEHTLRESKELKGIAVTVDELVDFVKNRNDYAIYYDPAMGDFIFATSKAKFIVRPNFKMKINKEKKSVFNYISATRISNSPEDAFRYFIKIKDAKQ